MAAGLYYSRLPVRQRRDRTASGGRGGLSPGVKNSLVVVDFVKGSSFDSDRSWRSSSLPNLGIRVKKTWTRTVVKGAAGRHQQLGTYNTRRNGPVIVER